MNGSAAPSSGLKRRITHFGATILWNVPGNFEVARLLGPSYGLRSILFHNISDQNSPFTYGIQVNTSPKQLEEKLRYIAGHYTPVSLEDVLASAKTGKLPRRAILVTFDDAYSSVFDIAAPLCKKYGVPVVFFVNAAFIDNQRLAADNIICYVASEIGMKPIAEAVHATVGADFSVPTSVTAVFSDFFPSISLPEREAFIRSLLEITGIDEAGLAAQAGLYLTSAQLRGLAAYGVEIGNHTYTHAHCRTLTPSTISREIEQNKEELEALSGTRVRSFSVPYGSSSDLTESVADHLRQSGHEAVFLSESVANTRGHNLFALDRVSTHSDGDADFFMELEILPRMRAIRNSHFRRSPSGREGAMTPDLLTETHAPLSTADGRARRA